MMVERIPVAGIYSGEPSSQRGAYLVNHVHYHRLRRSLFGFNATQSPLMARCLKTEKHARTVFFYGAIGFRSDHLPWLGNRRNGLLQRRNPLAGNRLANGGPKAFVYTSCTALMELAEGYWPWVLIACPITTGDTAFRAARLCWQKP